MNGFEAIHFIRPQWLWLLPLALLLPLLWQRLRQPAGDWGRVCDPHLLRWLSVQQGGAAGRRAGPWLAGLALAVAIAALAGPAWQKLPDASWSARDARVIALDLSRSMLAEDLRPDRLTRTRFRLADLLESTSEGQVGLVSYAGDAYVVSPLTNDMNTIANLLPALQPDIMPVAGSRADRALDMAVQLLERSGLARGEVLLVTDSASARDAAKARELRDRDVRVSVLAIGTAEGAPIPSGGGFISDRAGNVVIARMDRGALRAVAEAGGGRYSELAAAGADEALWMEHDGSEFERRDDALGERWKDAGPWLVLLLLPLAVAGFRRGLLFALPLALGLGAPVSDTQAADWEDLWLRKDQRAYRALQQGESDTAAALARDPALSGEAWYRSGEFANAQQAWSGRPDADAHYNRGNALARLGEFEAALAAYDQALQQQPGMEDAAHNRALVEQLLEQQRQQQEEQGEGEGEGDSGESPEEEPQPGEGEQQGESGEGEDGEESEGEPGEPQEGAEGEESQAQQAEYAESWSEEDAQAMEQWLRRIPDDPGGLLRRKFRSQHQRRGAPGDEGEAW